MTRTEHHVRTVSVKAFSNGEFPNFQMMLTDDDEHFEFESKSHQASSRLQPNAASSLAVHVLRRSIKLFDEAETVAWLKKGFFL